MGGPFSTRTRQISLLNSGAIMTSHRVVFPNADRVLDLIAAEPDAVVKSLLRLVYGEFMMKITAGDLPEGRVDLLYCFQSLQSAFRRTGALENAMNGQFAATVDAGWE